MQMDTGVMRMGNQRAKLSRQALAFSRAPWMSRLTFSSLMSPRVTHPCTISANSTLEALSPNLSWIIFTNSPPGLMFSGSLPAGSSRLGHLCFLASQAQSLPAIFSAKIEGWKPTIETAESSWQPYSQAFQTPQQKPTRKNCLWPSLCTAALACSQNSWHLAWSCLWKQGMSFSGTTSPSQSSGRISGTQTLQPQSARVSATLWWRPLNTPQMSEIKMRARLPQPALQTFWPLGSSVTEPLGAQSTLRAGQEPGGQQPSACMDTINRLWTIRNQNPDQNISPLSKLVKFTPCIELQMEELSAKITLLGQQLTLTSGDFSSLKPLVSPETLQQIRLPLRLSRFSINPSVLNVCLYYLVAVNCDLLPRLSAVFRERCLAEVGRHYLSLRMNFELYEYGYLCGNMLGIPLDKTIHMLYFLLYGRLAARPFVHSMIVQAERHPRGDKGTKTKLTDQDGTTTDHHTGNSRHLTVFCDSSNYEVEDFEKQLRETLRPPKPLKKQTKKPQNNFFFKKSKAGGESTPQSQEEGKAAERPVVTVPYKPTTGEVSAMIAHFKQRTGTQVPGQARRALGRRQKFNEYYDGHERLHTAVEVSACKENRYLEGFRPTQREVGRSNNQAHHFKSSKHNEEFFRRMAAGLRGQNAELDEIRGECVRNRQQKRQKRRGNSLPLNNPLFSRTHPTEPAQEQALADMKTARELQLTATSHGCLSRVVPIEVSAGQTKQISHHITRKAQDVASADSVLPLSHGQKKAVKTHLYKAEKKEFLEKKLFEKVGLAC